MMNVLEGVFDKLKVVLAKTTMMEDQVKEKLLRGSETQAVQAGESANDEVVSLSLKEKICKESKKMWVVAAPAIFNRFSTFGINVISQAFVGHIGTVELAGYALVATVLVRFTNGILVCFSPFALMIYAPSPPRVACSLNLLPVIIKKTIINVLLGAFQPWVYSKVPC